MACTDAYAAAATAGRDTGDEGDLSQEQPSWRDTSDDLDLKNIFCFLDAVYCWG